MMNIDEIIDILSSYVPDEHLQKLIFEGNIRRVSDHKKAIKYFSNLMIFVSFVTYRIFLNKKNELSKKSKDIVEQELASHSNSLMRLFNIFNDMYSKDKVNLEIFESLLINLEIDYKLTNNGFIYWLGITRFFNFHQSDNKLAPYLYDLKKYKVSGRYMGNFNLDALCEVMSMFPFISKLKLDYVEDSTFQKNEVPLNKVVLHFKNNFYEDVCLDDFVLTPNGRDFFYLDGFDFDDPRLFKQDAEKKQALMLTYLHFSMPSELKLIICNNNKYSNEKFEADFKICHPIAIEEFLIKYQFYMISNRSKNSLFFKNYMFFNNKYIKYLAEIISDLLDNKSKRELRKNYSNKYRDIFERLGIGNDNNDFNMRWDEIITFLLLEEGIYEFLKYVLKVTNVDYEEILNAFKLRFGNNVDKIKSKYALIANPKLNLQYKTKENITKNEAKALILLANKLLSINDFDMSFSYSPPALNDIVDELNEMQSEKIRFRNIDKISYYLNKIIHLHIFMISFYYGLLEYVNIKKNQELSEYVFDFTDFNQYDYEDIISVCLDKFSHKVKEVRRELYAKYHAILQIQLDDPLYFKKIKEYVVQSFMDFIKFNDMVSTRNTPENEQLFEALGTRKLFDNNDILRCLKGFEKILDENVSRRGEVTSYIVNKFFSVVIAYIEYLRDGSFAPTNNIEDAIYPTIGSYSSGVISRDGYRYSYMNVNHGMNNEQVKVKMVSEDDLKCGESYFCIPNINRIASIPLNDDEVERIWISPIIIPYSYYTINRSEEPVKLTNVKEEYFEEVSELLYYTDEKIYSSLFGNLENAKRILPILFNRKRSNESSIFYKDNIYVIFSGEHDLSETTVVAVATMYKSLPDWDFKIIEETFNEVNIPLPENFNDAIRYLENSFKISLGNNYIINDLCVKEKYRNQGYAKVMLNNLIRIADYNGKDVILIVYADNVNAFNLYQSMGFISYSTEYDSRGMNENNKEKYYRMIKFT